MAKNISEFNLKEFKENYDAGDIYMLDCIKDFITPDLEELYNDVLEYNEIYANGWTIEDLFKMGKTDSYWVARAENFIKKHNVSKKDYGEYTKYFDEYCELRNKLLKDLGLLKYIDDSFRKELPINEILSKVPKVIKEYLDYPLEDLKAESMQENLVCDSRNDLVYADNEVCYYDCHDGDYVFMDTQVALALEEETDNSYYKNQILYVNSLLENLLQVDTDKSLYNEISIKYNLYDCIKNNCYISDDLKKDLEGNQEIKDYKILSDCVDFPILKENISEEKLKQLEKGLESFQYYQSIYDDGNIDIIREYESKYGNAYLIDWYEGIMSTDSFIETVNLDKEGECCNEL